LQVATLTSNPLVTSVIPAHNAEVLVNQTISLKLSGSVQPADLERRFVLLPSVVTDVSSDFPTKLGLTAMCNGRWRVRNPNPKAAVFVWDVYKTTERGSGIAPANSDVFFETTPGQKTVRVFVGGIQHNTKAANTTTCTGALPSVPGKVGGFFSWNPATTEFSFTPNQPLALGVVHTVFLGLNDPFATNFTTVSQIQVPNEQPLDDLIDPNLPESEQQDFASVLAQLAPEVRGSVSYLAPDGNVYGSSDSARSGAEVLEPVQDNLFRSRDGNTYAYPATNPSNTSPASARPGMRPQAAATPSWQDVARCDRNNDGRGDGSGPFRRVTVPAGTSEARSNWMQVSLYLPKASSVRQDSNSRNSDAEAGNYKIQTPLGTITNGPFLYVGGWGSGTRIAVDAGFQLSTGNETQNPSGLWSPFIKAEAQEQSVNASTILKQLSDKPDGKMRGGQVISLTFFNLDDILVMVVKGKTQASGEQMQYRVLAMKLLNARQGDQARWRGDGIGNIFKMMTTIAQGRSDVGNAQFVQGDGAEGFLKNAAWFSPKIGYVQGRVPRYDSNANRWYAEGQYADYTVQPAPNAPPSDAARPFFGGPAIACEFPNNTTPAMNVIPVTNGAQTNTTREPQDPTKRWLLPAVVQEAPNDNAVNATVECVSIDLRQPVGLQISLIPPSISLGWNPPRPTCDTSTVRTQARAVVRPQSIQAISDLPAPETPLIELVTTGEPGASATKTMTVRNARGSIFSSSEVTVYPIGSYPQQINWGTVPKSLQTPVFPVWNPNQPWTTTTWDSYGPAWTTSDSPVTRLRSVNSDAALIEGDLERSVAVQGSCPSAAFYDTYRYSGVLGGDEYQQTMYVLHTTGLLDYGERHPVIVNGGLDWAYNSVGRPRAELQAVGVPIRLLCPSLRYVGDSALYFRDQRQLYLGLSAELRTGEVTINLIADPELELKWNNLTDPNAGGSVGCREIAGVFNARIEVTDRNDVSKRGVRSMRVQCKPTPLLEITYPRPATGIFLEGVDGQAETLSSWVDLKNTGWSPLVFSDVQARGAAGFPASLAPGETVRVQSSATCLQKNPPNPLANFQTNVRGGQSFVVGWSIRCATISSGQQSVGLSALDEHRFVPVFVANQGAYSYTGLHTYLVFLSPGPTMRVRSVRGWTQVHERVIELQTPGYGDAYPYRLQVFQHTGTPLPYYYDSNGQRIAPYDGAPELVVDNGTVSDLTNNNVVWRHFYSFSLRGESTAWDSFPNELGQRSFYEL
jgi:hypothetical protein